MPVFKITHTTEYRYNFPVKEAINEIRLFPPTNNNQEVVNYGLIITDYAEVTTRFDVFGNKIGYFNQLNPFLSMTIEAQMTVRVNDSNKIPDLESTSLKDLKEIKSNNIELLRYAMPQAITLQKDIAKILSKIDTDDKSIIEITQACCHYVYENFVYTKGITTIDTTIDELLVLKKGVCQDFANLLLQILRTAGIPSRYVSGYVCSYSAELRGEGATHAWVEIYSPIQGWLGIDPTNNIWVTHNHIKLAVGIGFSDCSPVKGTFKGIAKQSLAVTVTVQHEDGSKYKANNEVISQEIAPEIKEQLMHMEMMQQQ
jgi:transglutaminase-like putative cysteine protease